jgi:hypothetical protein
MISNRLCSSGVELLWCAVSVLTGISLIGCGGKIEEFGRVFGSDTRSEVQPVTAGDWPSDALVATNSVQLDQRARFSGNVSVTRSSPGPVLSQNAELALGIDSVLTGSARADTIFLDQRATISGSAAYNGITNSSGVQGTRTSPLSLPLSLTIPQLPSMTAGSQDVTISSNQTTTLAAGAYRDLNVAQGNAGQVTKLTLSGGTFTFNSLTQMTDTRLECSSPCEVRVVGRATIGARSYFGPANVPGVGAGNVQLLVKGNNGASGPAGAPAAVNADNDVQLKAYVLAPNGTLTLGQRVTFAGKGVAKDALVGIDTTGVGLQLPVITQQPAALTVWEHQPASLTVMASGPSITYQWQKNGANIAGKNASTLTFASTTPSDDAQYRVVITNAAGTTVSNAAHLTVIPCQSTDNDCDGVDDDCNGVADEDFLPFCNGIQRTTCSAGHQVSTSCDNGAYCDGAETCNAGLCASGPLPNLDDGNACTSDSCDEVHARPSHAPVAEKTDCDDGDPDNGLHRCNDSGQCVQSLHRWADSPVRLVSSATSSGSSSGVRALTAPISFEVPKFIPVTQGNAGRGSLVLRFRNGTGPFVECTYQGAALTDHPQTDLDRMLGLRYRFVSCTGGIQSGQSVLATDYDLDVISGDSTFPGGETRVGLNLGGGCDSEIPPPLNPAEVVAIREGFTWGTSAPLPETDPAGRPALFHGLAYIENKQQLQALDRMKVMWSVTPFSRHYREQLQGKCGVVQHSTDGKGVMVYVIFSAHVYNILRDFGQQAATAGIDPPFKFFSASPAVDEPDHFNTDGSLKYESLVASHYDEWLAQRLNAQPGWFSDFVDDIGDVARDVGKWFADREDDAGDIIGSGFAYATSGFDAAIDFIATSSDESFELTFEFFNLIARGIEGTMPLNLKISIVNRDPGFAPGSLMLRAWGRPVISGAGTPEMDPVFDAMGNPVRDAAGNPVTIPRRPRIVPEGASARVRQYGLGFIPLLSEHDISEDGWVVLQGVRGGSVPEVCIKLDAPYAMMTTDLIANEICDFPDANNPTHALFSDIDADVADLTEEVQINQAQLFLFTQLKDGSDFLKEAGHEPYKADVLFGWLANTLGGLNEGNPATICADFPATAPASADVLFAIAGGPAGFWSMPLIQKDMWWTDRNNDSRGIMTHEYGHFAMCSLLYGYEGPNGLDGVPSILREGKTASSDRRVMSEVIADSFALQVSGGANYVSLPDSLQSGNMSYCIAPDCADDNVNGDGNFSSDGFTDQVARWLTLVYDAFDGTSPASVRDTQNTHADYWAAPSGALEYTPRQYMGTTDEFVELPSSAWIAWMEKWFARGGSPTAPPGTPDIDRVMGGLSDAMADNHFNWCERCEVFGLHDPDVTFGLTIDPYSASVPHSFATRFGLWRTCIANESILAAVGAPPEPQLNVDLNNHCTACPPFAHFDTATGSCTSCPGADAVAMGDHCGFCGPGFVPRPDNFCDTCGPRDREVLDATSGKMVCETCPLGSAPDAATRTICEPCQADATLDLSGLSSCSDRATVTGSGTSAGDNCPGEFWVDVLATTADVWLTADVAPVAPEQELCLVSGVAAFSVFGDGSRVSTPASGPTFCTPSDEVFCDVPGCQTQTTWAPFAGAVQPLRTLVQPTAAYQNTARYLTGALRGSCPPPGRSR